MSNHSGRRALLVYPRFARNNLLNYENMTRFYPGKRAVMPPLGLITFAPLLIERGWEVRLVDENVAELDPEELHWPDAVFFSGMHPQRRRLNRILEEANALGKVTVVGGPSANICPEYYPGADAVHQGEIGDATELMLDWLDELVPERGAVRKPEEQRIFKTVEKTPLDEQPMPAIGLVRPNRYIIMPIQFSVGCPYTCEFCDIPVIYGRIARLKSPERVLAELSAIYDAGFVGTILFVDDNLIANRKAFRKLLPALVDWQKERRYPYPLTGEATINIARDEEILKQMHDARFTHLFLGVETPDPETLAHISKKQNLQDPIVQSIRIIEDHGIEVILGIIFGFDSDTPETGRKMTAFLKEANAPLIYFNMLAALPKTPLWERLEREGRLLSQDDGDARSSESLLSCLSTNVKYRLDNELVRRMLLDTVREIYSAPEVYRRMLWNAEHVYGKQIQGVPPTRTKEQVRFVLAFTAGTLANVMVGLGVRAPERREYWKFLAALVRLRAQGKIASVLEVLLRVTPNAHHLITWARTLLEDHERGLRSPVVEPEPRPVAKARPRIVVEGGGRATPTGLVPLRARASAAAG
ncbi:MAG TPA: B12-binding domain-containing radical SAM protein [Sandaracinaceae bacterium]